jgi:hypothetical protein
MNLLKWKTINDNGEKIVYAQGCIYRHWEIHKSESYNGYRVKLPELCGEGYGWEYYVFAKLQDAKDSCEYWNKWFLLKNFTEEERATLNKYFELMDKIEEAHENGY